MTEHEYCECELEDNVHIEDVLGEYPDLADLFPPEGAFDVTNALEGMIGDYGFESDGSGRVQFEADFLNGSIDVDAEVVIIEMVGGPVSLYGTLTLDEVTVIVDNLIDSAWQLEQELDARALNEVDEQATRDSVEDSITGLDGSQYLVLEGVWAYLEETNQWAALAEWFTEKAEVEYDDGL